ncbi:hypothetical protein B7C42_03166 [Nocardia cerradoensis]|uniref:Uncharacterized protein n=1 Tax=Nocardia cerradoensis TaxID=85688 RepID=A0A231H6I9_9NOCA|nr:hypothetical protein [Nocardia cerradoensis]OXR44377.1 hypothetical protein B7C42_03166 [Nocardia cerradoensis]
MDLPERRNEDARKVARGADDDGPAYLHHTDGTWSLVGPDGWTMDPADLPTEPAETAAITAPSPETVDVEPVSVRDREIQ